MRKELSTNIKWIITIIVSVMIGNLLTDILENIALNVWVARITGCSTCVVIALLFNHFWINKINNNKLKR